MNRLSHTVTVQIVTHNNTSTIDACIRSVRAQTYKDFSLFVIDNASEDTTVGMMRRRGVRVVVNTKNIGYSAAHNHALKLSNSRYVLTLNPDIEVTPSFLQSLVSAMDAADSRVGSAQALLYRIDRMGERSSIVDSAGLYIHKSRRQGLRFGGQDVKGLQLSPAFMFGPDGAAAFYRRSMLQDIDLGQGVFDKSFFMHKEDVDVCWRAQLRGWKSVFVPSAVGYHIRSFRPGKRTRVDVFLRMVALRNRYYLMIKNELPVLWVRDLLWIGFYDLGIFLYVLFRERESLPAYGQVLKNFGSTLEKRARIQRSRKVGSVYMAQWFRWRSI